MKTIDQLPEASGRYTIFISKFNGEPFTKEVIYDYEKGRWLEVESDFTLTVIGTTDKVIHEAEWYNINSFKYNSRQTQSTENNQNQTNEQR